MVRSGFVTACLLASCPTRRSPLFLSKATTDGVVRSPSELVITTGSPPSNTATQLLVVPRSIPMLLATSIPPARSRYLNRLKYKILVSYLQVCYFRSIGSRCGSIHVSVSLVPIHHPAYGLARIRLLRASVNSAIGDFSSSNDTSRTSGF